jgi:tetratricopeptide (TPR) repeat protein
MGRGLRHLRVKAWQEAIEGFDRAIQIDSDLYGELNQRLADAYRGLGLEHADFWRMEEAERQLNKAIEHDRWNAENYEALGRVYLKWSKWDKAAECLLKAVQLDPENFFWLRRKLSLAYFRWAIDEQRAGRADQADGLFNRARQWGLPLLEQPTRPVGNRGPS